MYECVNYDPQKIAILMFVIVIFMFLFICYKFRFRNVQATKLQYVSSQW